jgi:hypothetical protein
VRNNSYLAAAGCTVGHIFDAPDAFAIDGYVVLALPALTWISAATAAVSAVTPSALNVTLAAAAAAAAAVAGTSSGSILR